MEAKMIYYSKIMNILEKLKKVPQRGDYHPEGDVHTHTGIVFGRLNSFYNNPTLLLYLFYIESLIFQVKMCQKKQWYPKFYK